MPSPPVPSSSATGAVGLSQRTIVIWREVVPILFDSSDGSYEQWKQHPLQHPQQQQHEQQHNHENQEQQQQQPQPQQQQQLNHDNDDHDHNITTHHHHHHHYPCRPLPSTTTNRIENQLVAAILRRYLFVVVLYLIVSRYFSSFMYLVLVILRSIFICLS